MILLIIISLINNSSDKILNPDNYTLIQNFWPCPGGLNEGYSWPGVFLLEASGRTGRFFTQLLFHNPHSLNICFNTETGV